MTSDSRPAKSSSRRVEAASGIASDSLFRASSLLTAAPHVDPDPVLALTRNPHLPFPALLLAQVQVSLALARCDHSLIVESDRHPHRIGTLHGDRPARRRGRHSRPRPDRRSSPIPPRAETTRPPCPSRGPHRRGIVQAIALESIRSGRSIFRHSSSRSCGLFRMMNQGERRSSSAAAPRPQTAAGGPRGAGTLEPSRAAACLGSRIMPAGGWARLGQNETAQGDEQVRQEIQDAAPRRVA